MADEDQDYDWALGFDVWDGPGEKMPAQPMEPLPPGADASEQEQAAYTARLEEYAEAKRRYDAELAILVQDESYWRFTTSPFDRRSDAERTVGEFIALHQGNPLVRNPGLYRVPARSWERVELSGD
ncbi:hypothetical protein SEA_ZENTENO07_38 [Mycobacterium phage Zenteno07]|nr:hypothetical protein SEA_ZENTENO07_38 [Mycobacterium phage Zenteno07]